MSVLCLQFVSAALKWPKDKMKFGDVHEGWIRVLHGNFFTQILTNKLHDSVRICGVFFFFFK